MVPRKVSKLRDLRIVDSKAIIIKNLPFPTSRASQLKNYKYLGQYQNLHMIKWLSPPNSETLDTLIEFDCEISASLSFFSVLCMKLKNNKIKVFYREYVVCSDNIDNCTCDCKYHVKNRPEKSYFYKRPY